MGGGVLGEGVGKEVFTVEKKKLPDLFKKISRRLKRKDEMRKSIYLQKITKLQRGR